MLSLERELAQASADARRALRRADAVEATVSAAVEQLEKVHVELHRRNESLRQKTRTIYLIDRVLTGSVVDFVDVYWGTHHFWAFNVADSAISVGVTMLILDMLTTGTHASRTV